MATERIIIGAGDLLRALNEIARLGLETRPAMELIAQDWEQRTKAGFSLSRDPYANPWPATLRPGQPLRDTGRLLNSITHRSTERDAIVGTKTCYAIAHQTGATVEAGKPPHRSLCGYQTKGSPYLRFRIGRNGPWVTKRIVKIPARPIFPSQALGGLPKSWEEGAAKTLLNHLRSGLGKTQSSRGARG